ncbi:2OG-Fe(II) oxygenase [Polynucleobacter sp. es-GGE-1]|uniref:2OG-Fe(II) oxygenase n=1 Tax=Polynucleobacter sp. es-GGE-1 TaxID=1819724 RepID=UPI001C0AC26C|nr:2OG-Fe(II) oxygenase [Polynucleobacter sp. es-GGE-1]MBU3635526.1 2OG-Fe(II) oxygenase [Polynucleobacter sp. es-GGE-1]
MNSVNKRQELFVNLILSRLADCIDSIRTQWNSPMGTKTKHFFVDDLLPEDYRALLYEAFPSNGSNFFSLKSFREKKKTLADLSRCDPLLADITFAFQDTRVVNFIGNVLDIEGLEPDPSMYAGGLSMMFKGDYLNPHIDNSHDASRGRFRRLNILYYVSPGWSLERGGNFELWDDDISTPKTIVSLANRLVVMETSDKSWHSVSPVLEDYVRCCVSNYFFSKISPDEKDYFHVTSFLGRSGKLLENNLFKIDACIRNTFSRTFKFGRGKSKINKLKR